MKSCRKKYLVLGFLFLYLFKNKAIIATPSLTLHRFAQSTGQQPKNGGCSNGCPEKTKLAPLLANSSCYHKLVPEIVEAYYQAGLISSEQKAHLLKNAHSVLPLSLPALRDISAGRFLVSHELLKCLIRHGATPRDTFHNYASSGLATVTSTTLLTALLKKKAPLSRIAGVSISLLATYPVLAFYRQLEHSIDQARRPAQAAQALPFVSLTDNGFIAAQKFYKEQGHHEQFRLSLVQKGLLNASHAFANLKYLMGIGQALVPPSL